MKMRLGDMRPSRNIHHQHRHHRRMVPGQAIAGLLLASWIATLHGQLLNTAAQAAASDAPVCKTYIRIEDKSQAQSLLRVQSPIVVTEAFPLSSITVRNLRLKHPRVGSLKVDLTAAPAGGSPLKRITLKPLRAGGMGADMYDTTFSEAKPAKPFPFSEAAAPFSSTYLPEIPLTVLMAGNGTSAGEGGSAGSWTLVVTDFGRREKNETRQIQLDRWTLILCTNATQAPAPVIIPPATSLLSPADKAAGSLPKPMPLSSSTTPLTGTALPSANSSTIPTQPTTTNPNGPMSSTSLPLPTQLLPTNVTAAMTNASTIGGGIMPALPPEVDNGPLLSDQQSTNMSVAYPSPISNTSTAAGPLLSGIATLPGTVAGSTSLTGASTTTGSTILAGGSTTAGTNNLSSGIAAAGSTELAGSSSAGRTVLPGDSAAIANTFFLPVSNTTGADLPAPSSVTTSQGEAALPVPAGLPISQTAAMTTPQTIPMGTASNMSVGTMNNASSITAAAGGKGDVKRFQGPEDGSPDSASSDSTQSSSVGLDPSRFSFWDLGSGSNLARLAGFNLSEVGEGSNFGSLISSMGQANRNVDRLLGDYGLDRQSLRNLFRDINPLVSAFSGSDTGINKTQQAETVISLLTLGINALANTVSQNLGSTAREAVSLKDKYQLNTGDNLGKVLKVATYLPRAYTNTIETYAQLLNDTGSILNRVLNDNAGLLTQLSSSLRILGNVVLNNLETNLNATLSKNPGASTLRSAYGQFKDLYQEYDQANQGVLDVAKSLVPDTKTSFQSLQSAFKDVVEEVGSILGNATKVVRSSKTDVLRQYADTVSMVTEALTKYVRSARDGSLLLKGSNGQLLKYVNQMLDGLRKNSEELPGFKRIMDLYSSSNRGDMRQGAISWPNYSLLNMVKNIDLYFDAWNKVVGSAGLG